jgi:hypothetical protein
MPWNPCQIFAAMTLLVSACSSTAPASDKLKITFSKPTEADAVELETKYTNGQDVRSHMGEPVQIRGLSAQSDSPCTERWFYTGKVNITGLGPIDMLTYVDFDAAPQVCRHPKRQESRAE